MHFAADDHLWFQTDLSALILVRGKAGLIMMTSTCPYTTLPQVWSLSYY